MGGMLGGITALTEGNAPMPLKDTQIRNAKPKEKPYKLSDSGGLYVYITPSGGKLWRLKYRLHGTEKTLSIGKYPEISIAEARKQQGEAKERLRQGIDPSQFKKQAKLNDQQNAANSFEVVAREWLAKNQATWAESNAKKVTQRLEKNALPWLGRRPINTIEAPELLTMARRIENRGAIETAHRVLQDCGAIFRYAIATGRAIRNPVPDLKGALSPVKHTHFAAIVDPQKVGELLRSFDKFNGTFPVLCALRLAPLLFCRPSELRQAKWAEIDLEAGEWRYLVTKTNTQHLVPLSRQAISIFSELKPLTGRSEWVFPGARTNGKPMSEATVNAALRRLGYDTQTEITGHGFRAMARTLLHERLGVNPHAIEHQLAHAVPDALGAAYNRTKFLDERRQMMQTWADYLDKLKQGAEVIPLRA